MRLVSPCEIKVNILRAGKENITILTIFISAGDVLSSQCRISKKTAVP